MKNHPSLRLAMAAVFAFAGGAFAQTTTNINWSQGAAGSYNWIDTANWSGANIPDSSGESATFTSNGTSFLNAGTFNVNIGSPITLGGLTLSGVATTTSTLNFTGSAITLNNTTTSFSNRARVQRNTNSPLLIIANDLVLGDADGVEFVANANFRVNGVISGSGFQKITGSGQLYLGGVNTFNGALVTAGNLIALNTNALSSTSGTINFTGATAVVGLQTGVAGTTAINNALDLGNITQGLTLNSDGTGSTLDITTSSISNAGGSGAISIGRFAGDASYGLAAGTGTGTVKFSGSGFTISKNVTGFTNQSILEFSPSSGTQTWSGNFTGFAGTSNIVKSGAGTAALGGANTYVSQTVVNVGTLLLNGTHVTTASTGGLGRATTGNFQVESGATLGGAGRIAVGVTSANTTNNAILVKSGGFLAPGSNGIGTLTMDAVNFNPTGTGTDVYLNMASGSQFNFDLDGSGGTPDSIALWNYASGDLLLNNNAINLDLLGTTAAGTYTVTLFSFFSNSGVTLTASGIASGLTLGSLDANISSANIIYGTNTIDLQYTVVPEPSTWLLLAGSLTSLMVLRRRTR